MKTTAILLPVLGLFGVVCAQTSTAAAEDPGPSPTESVGCEPHGDHWHCDAPAAAVSTDAAGITTTGAIAEATLPPSPVESMGCEAHEDHWDCEAPATAVTTDSAGMTTTEAVAEAGETLPPSPVESVGCEPHGDHWHCDGPASTMVTPAPSSPASAAAEESTSAEMQTVNDAILNKIGGMQLAFPVAVGLVAVLP